MTFSVLTRPINNTRRPSHTSRASTSSRADRIAAYRVTNAVIWKVTGAKQPIERSQKSHVMHTFRRTLWGATGSAAAEGAVLSRSPWPTPTCRAIIATHVAAA